MISMVRLFRHHLRYSGCPGFACTATAWCGPDFSRYSLAPLRSFCPNRRTARFPHRRLATGPERVRFRTGFFPPRRGKQVDPGYSVLLLFLLHGDLDHVQAASRCLGGPGEPGVLEAVFRLDDAPGHLDGDPGVRGDPEVTVLALDRDCQGPLVGIDTLDLALDDIGAEGIDPNEQDEQAAVECRSHGSCSLYWRTGSGTGRLGEAGGGGTNKTTGAGT